MRSLEVAGPQTGAGVGLVDFGIALDAIMWSQRSLVWWDRFTARRAAWRRSCGGWPSPGALLHRSVLGGAVVQPDDRRLKGVREGRSSQRDFTADDASSSMVAVCGLARRRRDRGVRRPISLPRRPADRELSRALWGTDRYCLRSHDGHPGLPSSRQLPLCGEPLVVHHHHHENWVDKTMEAKR